MPHQAPSQPLSRFGFADTVVPPSPALFGTAAWAAGYSGEENPFDAGGRSEGWSVFQKAFLFGIILTAVAVWVKVTRRRDGRDEVGFEKTMA